MRNNTNIYIYIYIYNTNPNPGPDRVVHIGSYFYEIENFWGPVLLRMCFERRFVNKKRRNKGCSLETFSLLRILVHNPKHLPESNSYSCFKPYLVMLKLLKQFKGCLRKNKLIIMCVKVNNETPRTTIYSTTTNRRFFCIKNRLSVFQDVLFWTSWEQ